MLFAITLAGVIALPFVFPHFYLTLITFRALSFITILARYKWKRLHSAFILPHFFCFLGFAAGSFIYHGALTGIVISIIGYLLCAWSSSKVSNTQEQNIGKETDLIPDSRPRELSEELFQVTRKDINSPIYFQKTYSDYQQVKFWRLPSFFSTDFIRQHDNFEKFTQRWNESIIRQLGNILPGTTWLPAIKGDKNTPFHNTLYATRNLQRQPGLQYNDLYFVLPSQTITIIRLTEYTCRGAYWYTLSLENKALCYELKEALNNGETDLHELYHFMILLATAWALQIELSFINMN